MPSTGSPPAAASITAPSTGRTLARLSKTRRPASSRRQSPGRPARPRRGQADPGGELDELSLPKYLVEPLVGVQQRPSAFSRTGVRDAIASRFDARSSLIGQQDSRTGICPPSPEEVNGRAGCAGVLPAGGLDRGTREQKRGGWEDPV